MNPDVDGLLEQVQRQQRQVADIQRSIEAMQIKAASRGDEVTVTMLGTGRVSEVSIAPEALRRYDSHDLGDIIVEALNNAQQKLAEATKAKFAPVIDAAGRISG